MSVLRVYTPAECDADGVPLGWERCDDCEGAGTQTIPGWLLAGEDHSRVCPHCDGHGSLKAAALAGRRAWALAESGYPGEVRSLRVEDGRYGAVLDETYGMGAVVFPNLEPVRCEDCGHPMSEGTWVVPDAEVPRLDTAGLLTGVALQALRQGVPDWENGLAVVHYSPCDEGCRHGDGGLRLFDDSGEPDARVTEGTRENADEVIAAYRRMGRRIEASWRSVDVRRLSWDHDLRPEMLAVLCLRCFAERER